MSVSYQLLWYNHFIINISFVFFPVLLVNSASNLIIIYSINIHKYMLLPSHGPLSLIPKSNIFDNWKFCLNSLGTLMDWTKWGCLGRSFCTHWVPISVYFPAEMLMCLIPSLTWYLFQAPYHHSKTPQILSFRSQLTLRVL